MLWVTDADVTAKEILAMATHTGDGVTVSRMPRVGGRWPDFIRGMIDALGDGGSLLGAMYIVDDESTDEIERGMLKGWRVRLVMSPIMTPRVCKSNGHKARWAVIDRLRVMLGEDGYVIASTHAKMMVATSSDGARGFVLSGSMNATGARCHDLLHVFAGVDDVAAAQQVVDAFFAADVSYAEANDGIGIVTETAKWARGALISADELGALEHIG